MLIKQHAGTTAVEIADITMVSKLVRERHSWRIWVPKAHRCWEIKDWNPELHRLGSMSHSGLRRELFAVRGSSFEENRFYYHRGGAHWELINSRYTINKRKYYKLRNFRKPRGELKSQPYNIRCSLESDHIIILKYSHLIRSCTPDLAFLNQNATSTRN